MLGVPYIRLGKSLRTQDILIRPNESWYAELSELSRTDLSEEDQNAVVENKLFSYDLAAKMVEEMSSKYGFECYGLDVLVEEGTLDLYLIDFNDLPGYLGFPYHSQLSVSICAKVIKH